MSIYYNQEITNREKDKRYDLIAAPTWLGPTSQVCYHDGQEGHFCKECLRGDSPGDSSIPKQDPALSAKVTTGGLSVPISWWKARCHLLWIDGSQLPVHAPLLGIDAEEPHDSHYDKKKNYFPLDSGAHFSVLSFSPGPQSNDKVIIQGKSGQPIEF
jgi:hypothetical protein